MTNDDVKYSVWKRSVNNSKDKLNISLYICTCHDFKRRQLLCKHIFAVFSQLNNSIEKDKQNLSLNSIAKEPISKIKTKNTKIEKLQDDLFAIAKE